MEEMKTEAEWTREEVLALPPKLLVDMRAAWAGWADTVEQVELRASLKRKPDDFLDRMTSLERAYEARLAKHMLRQENTQKAGKEEPQEQEAPVEEKELRVVDLIKRLREEWGDERDVD